MVSPIKLKRVQKEISQTDLFLKTGIPAWRISLIERGIIPQEAEAEKLAHALNAPVNELFPALAQAVRG